MANKKWAILPKKIGAFFVSELPDEVKDYLSDTMTSKGAKSLLPIVREMLMVGARLDILKLKK